MKTLSRRLVLSTATLATLAAATTPDPDVGEDCSGRVPPIDRETERRFRDEHVAAERFKGFARRIRRALVVPGDHPHTLRTGDSNLSRAEHMARWMKAELDRADAADLSVSKRFDRRIRPEPAAKQRRAGLGAEIAPVARPRVVTVSVRDHRAIDRSPRIDMESSGLAEKARGCFDQHWT